MRIHSANLIGMFLLGFFLHTEKQSRQGVAGVVRSDESDQDRALLGDQLKERAREFGGSILLSPMTLTCAPGRKLSAVSSTTPTRVLIQRLADFRQSAMPILALHHRLPLRRPTSGALAILRACLWIAAQLLRVAW